MPIYAYRCEHCGHAKDVLQKVSDPVLTVCPACGEPTFRKQVTAAGFQLKGSGWYVTDFRGDKTAKRGDAGETGDDKPADGKPADGKPAEAASGESSAAAGKDSGGKATAVGGKAASEPGREKPAAAPAAAAPAAGTPAVAPPSPSGTGSSGGR